MMTFSSVYSIASIREIERLAVTQEGISEWSLMQRAAQATFTVVQQSYPNLNSISVFCGAGNNAGDGLLLAALAQSSGIQTQVFVLKEIDKMEAAAAKAAQAALDAGIVFAPLAAYSQAQSDLFIDALLGIGVSGNIHGLISEVVGWLNSQKTEVLAVDVPTGLDANTGRVLGMAVKARKTVTFIGSKVGMHTADGPDYVGHTVVDSLGLDALMQSQRPAAKLVTSKTIRTELPVRPKNCHKGDFGHVLLIGGGKGMPGAILLAAKAALRVGAGLVSVATHPDHIGGAISCLPEAMTHGVKWGRNLRPLLAKATVIVLGPGLGKGLWARSLYSTAIQWKGPKVVDASALSMLAEKPIKDNARVITPHSGEAGHLLACKAKDIQASRLEALQRLHQRYGGTVVLKGCGSLIASKDHLPYLCDAGNPGMATGGMGDVLSGVIAGLMAQHLTPFNAAALGVFVHAQAADCSAIKLGARGLLASDVIMHLSRIVNP